jgi:hypothetical protein
MKMQVYIKANYKVLYKRFFIRIHTLTYKLIKFINAFFVGLKLILTTSDYLERNFVKNDVKNIYLHIFCFKSF